LLVIELRAAQRSPEFREQFGEDDGEKLGLSGKVGHRT
jgi:hypothetical protein